MGITVEYRKMSDKQAVYQLMVYCNVSPDIDLKSFSINKPLAAELFKIPLSLRSMQLEKCFMQVIKELPSEPIIKDIDVMFNPAYKVDVMKVLISAYKQKAYSLIWPGSCFNGKLLYSEENYPDYQAYEIKNYDIICVIC